MLVVLFVKDYFVFYAASSITVWIHSFLYHIMPQYRILWCHWNSSI